MTKRKHHEKKTKKTGTVFDLGSRWGMVMIPEIVDSLMNAKDAKRVHDRRYRTGLRRIKTK